MVQVVSHALPDPQLPAQAHELIGRDRDVEQARNALLQPDIRLVTILGMAGIGKTRLAVAVAESAEDHFADGVYFVDLSQITDAASLPALLAITFHVGVIDENVLELLTDYLAHREMLLVLDNFEHVLPGAVAVARILEACPHVTILATSREPLRLRWEQRLTLGPLGTPDLAQLPSPDALIEIPSVALFMQRARALDMRLEFDDETLHHIAEMCVRLEGVPLALELAAARIRVLSPAAMLRRFDTLIGALRQRAADVPERHGSIRAALETSYRPLSVVEQAAFRRLGVFVGGWTSEAFEAVAEAELEGVDALETLASLADKALIVAEPVPGEVPRFRMLETIRSFALELLAQEGERESARAAHARYYLALAEREAVDIRAGGPFVFSVRSAETRKDQGPRLPWPDVLDRELENIHAALQWADETADDVTLLRLSGALRRYWWVRGLLQEGAHWLELALERNPGAEPALRSPALSGLGIIYRQQGKVERAHTCLQAAVALSRTLDDRQLLATQLLDLGATLAWMHRVSDGVALVEDSARLSESEDDDWGVAAALSALGMGGILTGANAATEARLENGLQRFRTSRDRRSVVIVAQLLAYVVATRGGTSRALSLLDETLEMGRDLLPDVIIGSAIEIAAAVLLRVAAPDACARLLGAGDAVWVRGLRRTPVGQYIYDRGLTVAREKLDPERLDAALEEGGRLSLEQAIDEARVLIRLAMTSSARRRRAGDSALTGRELEVLALMAGGYTNKEIGNHLGITVNTTKFHVTSVLNKLGVDGRVEAVTEAVRRGLV